MIKAYYMLTKPKILFGNIITTAGGFALASKGHFDLFLFVMTLIGLILVIGSACAFNCYTDRDADEKMERTKNRPLVKGSISVTGALIFAVILAVLGVLTLYLYTNLLTTAIAVLGFFFYVVMYGFWKYKSTYGTLIGSIAGAVPPVIGYCAVSNQFNLCAALLFTILVFWQMPHFYAIAIYRVKEYAAASIPVLPVKRGNHITKVHMLLYTIAFILASFSLIFFGYTGYAYLIVTGILSFIWLFQCIKGFKAENDVRWARGVFRFSLIVIMALSLMISIDAIK